MEEDNGVFQLVFLLQIIQQAAKVLIQQIDHSIIGRPEHLVIPFVHGRKGVIARGFIGAPMILRGKQRLLLQFALGIVGQGDLLNALYIFLQQRRRRIKGMVGVVIIDGEEKGLLQRQGRVYKLHRLIGAQAVWLYCAGTPVSTYLQPETCSGGDRIPFSLKNQVYSLPTQLPRLLGYTG